MLIIWTVQSFIRIKPPARGETPWVRTVEGFANLKQARFAYDASVAAAERFAVPDMPLQYVTLRQHRLNADAPVAVLVAAGVSSPVNLDTPPWATSTKRLAEHREA